MSIESPLPPPLSVLADWMARRAWDDDVGDYDRQLLEHGADAIRQLITDRLRAVNRAEHLEAYCQTLMGQQGGAS